MAHIPKLLLSERRDSVGLPIEILVGGNHYWKIVKDSPPWRISRSLVLLPSRLRWVLRGNRSVISANVTAINFLHLERPGPLPETEIKRFWDLKTIGNAAHQEELRDKKDSAVLLAFRDSFRIEDS